MASSTIVAIPARNEAERIGVCVAALQEQTMRPDAVVVLLNNCSDTSATILRAMAPRLDFRLDVICQDFPQISANAGHARRLAMALANQHVGPGGVLLTTDADAVVPPDWIARNLMAIRLGADIVCGRAVIDPIEAAMIPAHLHADDEQECRLIGLLDDLAWMLDPEPHDPPPRHTEASGASLAVRAAAFRFIGGIPAIASGEDRAFVRALWMTDARVRHDPSIHVTVSGRIEGRAAGGMADAIRRRIVRQDEFTDDQAEPTAKAYQRYRLRQRVRRAWNGASDQRLSEDLALPRKSVAAAMASRFFGTAWAGLEANSPTLKRQRVAFVSLPTEIQAAERLLRQFAAPEVMAAE